MPEFLEWQHGTKDWNTWKVKYYKGLGTSTSKEAKEYFSNMTRHCIKFEYLNVCDDLAIQLAFSKKLVEQNWIGKLILFGGVSKYQISTKFTFPCTN